MMFWYDHSLGAWGWVGMILTMIAFWGLVVIGVVWLLRGTGPGDRRSAESQERGPEQLLAERFARGEIDDVEYRDRLAALRGESRRPPVRG